MGKALMVQGTASHVGKSVLVAGLCRIFHQDGFRVAPFKAQNMALNSFATPDGGEIGRAQAVQAEAACAVPYVDMNPILLKPEGDSRSQLVVGGKVWGTLDAAAYHERKLELWPLVQASLGRLMERYDVVVIEGAGSPVEMNLKDRDIVNMRVARAAGAPVLLVADIERGGVFAALVGTMRLLAPAEQRRVAGFVVNKFRGDPTLFAPGVAIIEKRLRRPVLGVVPWIEDIGLAEEDSLGVRSSEFRVPGSEWNRSRAPHSELGTRNSELDIAVVKLPHIANFDDFDALAARPGVRLRYVDKDSEMRIPDLVILPGTKTTRADLDFVRGRGIGDTIVAHVQRGCPVLGICGGYQMLGDWIDDVDGVEGPPGVVAGLGLLPARTRYAREKTTIQVRGRVVCERGLLGAAQGLDVSAYEIHMGRTETRAAPAFSIVGQDGAEGKDGAVSEDGIVAGTYLHGLFGNPGFLEAVVQGLARARGVALPPAPPEPDPYDRLASLLRTSLDIDRIRAMVTA